MLEAYAWAWADNQVLAAVTLIPLGQSAGQRMLHALHDRLAEYAARAFDLMDSDIGISTALSTVASGRHEVQYTRLFRS
jgi:urease accessory protein